MDDAPTLLDGLQTMARYHAWATQRLFESVDALPDANYRRDTGLFFRSVHGTLNHMLVAERLIWWPRFAAGVSPVQALDAEAEPDRARLRERLLEAAAAWLPFVCALPPARLAGRIEYRRLDGRAMSLPYAATLQHVFNHATHHRGQVSAAVTACGAAFVPLDLAYMLQQEAPTP